MSTDLVAYEEQLRKELANLKETVEPPSSNKIGLKGKVFALPTGDSGPGPLRVIVLDYIAVNKYYPGVYNSSKPEPPKCWAMGRNLKELAPTIENPEHKNCEACARNAWGSGRGGSGKACKNQRRLLVVAPPEDGQPFPEPLTIEVSPAGLKGWNKYIDKELATLRGLVPIQVVTEISFDPNQSYPLLQFSFLEKHARVAEAMQVRANYQDILLKTPEAKDEK